MPLQVAYARAASKKEIASDFSSKAWTQAEEEEKKGNATAKAKLAAAKAVAALEHSGDVSAWLEAVENEIHLAEEDVSQGVKAYQAMANAKEAELKRQKAAKSADKAWKPVADAAGDAVMYMGPLLAGSSTSHKEDNAESVDTPKTTTTKKAATTEKEAITDEGDVSARRQ